jgi:hypothetical protein
VNVDAVVVAIYEPCASSRTRVPTFSCGGLMITCAGLISVSVAVAGEMTRLLLLSAGTGALHKVPGIR